MAFWDFFRLKRPGDLELDSELRFHLDELIEEKIAAGLTPEQARREARLEFGARPADQRGAARRTPDRHHRYHAREPEIGDPVHAQVAVVLAGRDRHAGAWHRCE